MNHCDVGVVGGGLGGLAAACTLAAHGYRVVLCERNEFLGGKACVWEQDGYRFDMGPTILTLPSVLRRIFAEADRSVDDYVNLVRLDPQWRCFFQDGSELDLVEQIGQMQANIAALTGSPQDASGYQRLMQVAERQHEVARRYFFYQSVSSFFDALTLRDWLSPGLYRDLLAIKPGQSVSGLVRTCVSDERVAQMLDHFTQYVGSSPEASPAVLCGIGHMQTEEGIWYPIGGTRAVAEALIRLAGELGVEFRTGVNVERITTEAGHVTGMQLNTGEVLTCEAIVSNCDSMLTHQELLSGAARERFERRREYEPACSGVVLYLGLRQRYEHLLHHNFVFSRDPEEEFTAIYRTGEPAPDPTCYVCAPAVTEPDVAPPGGEALYVLVHTPYRHDGQDWTAMLPDYRECILQKLRTTGQMPDLDERIVVESVLTPADIESRYHVWRGAIYGLASHGLWTGGFKPVNRSPDVRGLYLAGGSAHPGPGMPMVMMSGWIAADCVARDGVAGDDGPDAARGFRPSRSAAAESA